jgi:YD repeat-containing protein
LAFTYDSAGELLTASNQNGTHTFAYQNGKLTGVREEPFGLSLTLGYDSADLNLYRHVSNNPTNSTDPSG